MEIKVYEFPTKEDGLTAIEREYCRLLNLKRTGENLDEVQENWMDYANNVLMEMK